MTDLDNEFLTKSQELRAQNEKIVRMRQYRWVIVSLAFGMMIALILICLAIWQWLQAERLKAQLGMQQGLSYCQQGEVADGMLYLTQTLEKIPHWLEEIPYWETDLQRII